MQQARLFFILYVSISAIAIGFTKALLTQNAAVSLGVGAGVMGFVLGVWAIVILVSFLKKFVAMAILAIVIKYVILAIILTFVVNQPWFVLGWFVVGLLVFIPAGLLSGAKSAF